jgi:hypothetical protein
VTPSGELVVGWRVWGLEHDRLRSLAANYSWQAEENEAVCLKDQHACDASPGLGCKCGFWALWDPARSVSMARSQPNSVLGIVAGWGTVALHGTEGFRAQFAMVRCLLRDWPWDETLTAIAQAGIRARWQRALLPWRPKASQEWISEICRAASRYRVPLISLTQAVPLGVLAELGVDGIIVSQLDARLRRSRVAIRGVNFGPA